MSQRDPHGTQPTVNRLMEWMARPEWAELYHEVLEEHVSAVLEDFEIESTEELSHTIGEDLYSNVVFGVTFEDFVTQSNEAGETIVDEYLRRRGYRESVPGRRYLEGLRDSVMSLYEVIESIPGSHLVLRDRLRGGEPMRVEERQGSRSIVKWDRLGARVIPFNRQWLMSGAPLLFEPEMADLLEQTLNQSVSSLDRRLRTTLKRLDVDKEPSEEQLAALVEAALQEIGEGPQDADGSNELVGENELVGAEERRALLNIALVRAAPLFTRFWLIQRLERIDAPPPQLRNTDGEELLFVETRWPIAEGSVATAVRAIEREEEKSLFRYSDDDWHWSWQARPAASDPRQGQLCFVGEDTNDLSMATYAANSDGEVADSVSLGSVLIEGSDVILRTNSAQRADRGKAMIERLLANLIGPAASTTETADEYWQRTADDPPLPALEAEGPTPEDKARILGAMLERHYRRWPDIPVPALDGKTPREAATSPEARVQLAKLLKRMENSEQRRVRHDGGPAYDFGWLRQELGISEFER